MKLEKLKKTLALGESQTIEFKPGTVTPAVIGPVVCGFLNSSGGYLVCGVSDSGNVIGIDVPDTRLKELEAGLQRGLSPKALVSVDVIEMNDKSVFVVEVPAGKDFPYAFSDIIYIRDREHTRKASVDEIRDMVLRKQVEPIRWERRFSSAELETDIDPDEVVGSARKIRNVHGLFKKSSDPYQILEELSAIRYGRLTNAGDVLFARNPALRYPQVRVRAVSLPENRASNMFRDMKSFEGPLVQVLNQSFDFIMRNTATRSAFAADKLQRQDESHYPPDAIREGLVNAFAHRDYADFSGGIIVSVYPTRVEIWNSGGLPDGVTPEGLAVGHISVLRNPDIAHVLYLRGLMEKLGRGSVLILQQCEKYGLPAPQWVSSKKAGVTLTFFATEVTPEATPEVTPEVTPEATPEVERLLEMLDGEKSRKELQAALGLKDDDHFRVAYLLPAINQNLIEMTLPDKPTSSKQRYRLTAAGRALLGGHRS